MKKNIILTLIIAACVIGGFWYFSKQEVKEEFKEISINDEIVKNLYAMANPSKDYTSLKDVYLKNTFTNDFILGSGLVSILKEKPLEKISEEEMNLAINKIFGNITFAHNSGYMIAPHFCAFQYDKVTHSYSYKAGCEETENIKLIKELVGAKKSDTVYVLTEKMILVKKDKEEKKDIEEEFATIKIYNDITENKQIKEFTYNPQTEKEPKIELKDFLNEASTYEYHFEFDGNSFVYKKLQKVG